MPPVKSSDPRKAVFVAKVRAEFPHVSKVTDVREARGVLSGEALEYDSGTRTYWRLGEVRVEAGRAELADRSLRDDYLRLQRVAAAHARIGHGLHYALGTSPLHYAWGTSPHDRPALRLYFRHHTEEATLSTLANVLRGQGLGAYYEGSVVTLWASEAPIFKFA